MSTLYPDLTLTNFPNNVDEFITWLNIISTDGPLIVQYQQAMQAGNTTQANQILNTIPNATQKILTSTSLNKLTQAILAVERFYSSDIESYINNLQESWTNSIQQFSYKGSWSSGTTYVTNNMVSYTINGINYIYIAIANPPIGTNPSNNSQYWRILTIQGQQGSSGTGLSYRQEWNVSTSYSVNDTVTYDGGLWIAVQPSQGEEPSDTSGYWNLIMALSTTTYPIQDTQPTVQNVGDLWFNTQGNPTQYYYLSSLDNPASASNIQNGYEAYDAYGNLIVGTLT